MTRSSKGRQGVKGRSSKRRPDPAGGGAGGRVSASASLDRLVALLDGLSLVCYATDAEGRLMAANSRFLSLVGRTSDEVVGRPAAEVLPPEAVDEDRVSHERACESSGPVPFMLLWVHPDGAVSALEGHRSRLDGLDGTRGPGTIAVAWDATGRMSSEAAQTASDNRFRTFFQNCPVPLLEQELEGALKVMVGEDGTAAPDLAERLRGSRPLFDEVVLSLETTAYNRAMLALLGASTHQEVDHAIKQNLMVHGREAFQTMFASIAHGATECSADTVLRDVKGQDRQVSVRLSVVRVSQRPDAAMTAGPRVLGVVCITDLTELKGTQERLVDERRRAQMYIDLLVHDIRNLTQGILTSSEILSGSPNLPKHLKRYADGARRHAGWIGDLVTKVLTVSHAEMAVEGLRTLELTDVVRAAVDRVCSNQRERAVMVNFTPPLAMARVKADLTLVEAIVDLLDIAISLDRHERAVIDIEVRPAEGGTRWVLVIADRGPGVPDAAKRRVFERFERAGVRTPGAGLGLAMVDGVVRRLGGRAWLEDRVPGDHAQGSSVLIELPALA